ncbi:hypothetical protein HPP92_003080 [Vanilla planifolia]|uniref:Uncharacterized protein n=1 Tax=Vanilla planifolia TaxID=51239 RepID=A0A835RZB4_VANPL|nr:hypothetical protein HPP92_003080 [Vanilla planifolia]
MERDQEEKTKEIVDHDINKDDADLINIVDRRGKNQVDSFDGEPAKAEMEQQIGEPQQETLGEELQEVTEEIDQHFHTTEKNKINEATEQSKPIVGKEDLEDFSNVAPDNYNPNSSTSNLEEEGEAQLRNENYLEEHQKSVPRDVAGEDKNIKPARVVSAASSIHDLDTDEMLNLEEDANASAKVQEQSFNSAPHYLLNEDSEHKNAEEDPEQKIERIPLGEKRDVNTDKGSINDGAERNQVESTNNISGVPEIHHQILELQKEIAGNDEVVLHIKEGQQEITEEFNQQLSLLIQKHEGTGDVESEELSVYKEEKLEQCSLVDTQQSKAKYETNTEQGESSKGLSKDIPEEKKEAEVSTGISTISDSNFKAQSPIEETKTKKPEEVVFPTEASEEHQEKERDPEAKIKEIIDPDANKDNADLLNIIDHREANQVDRFDGEPATTELEAQTWEPQQEIAGEELQRVIEEIDQHFCTVEKKNQINEATEQGKLLVGKEEDLEDFSNVAPDNYNPNSSTSNHKEESESQIRNENYLEELQKSVPRNEACEDMNIKPACVVSAANSINDLDTDEMLQLEEDANTSAKVQEQSFNSAPHYLLNEDSEHKHTEEDPEQKIERIVLEEKRQVNTDNGNINDGEERNQIESTNNISGVPEIRHQSLELQKEIAGNDEVVLLIKESHQKVTEEFDQHLSLLKQKHEGTGGVESEELSVCKEEKLEQCSLVDTQQSKAKYETNTEQGESSKGLSKDVPEEKMEAEVSTGISSISESNFKAQTPVEETKTKKPEEVVFPTEASEEYQEKERDPEEKIKEIIDPDANKDNTDLVNIVEHREANQVDRFDGEPTATDLEAQIWEPQQEIAGKELQKVIEEIDQHFYTVEKNDQINEATNQGKPIVGKEEDLEDFSNVALDNYNPNSSTSNHEEEGEAQLRDENYLEEFQKSVPSDEPSGDNNVKPARLVSAASSIHDLDTDEMLQHKEDANTNAKVQEQSLNSTPHYLLNEDSKHKDTEEDPERKIERIALGENSHVNTDTGSINDGTERNQVESTNNISSAPEIGQQILELQKEIAGNDEVVLNIKEGHQEVTEEFDRHLSLLKQKHEGTENIKSGELSVSKDKKLEQSSVKKETILEDTPQIKEKYEESKEQAESSKELAKDIPEEKKEEVSRVIFPIVESNFRAQSPTEETQTKKSEEETVFLNEALAEHQETEKDPEEKMNEIIDHVINKDDTDLVNVVDGKETNLEDRSDGEPTKTEMEGQICESQQEIVDEELQEVAEEIDQHFYATERKDKDKEVTEPSKLPVYKEEILEESSPKEFKESNIKLRSKQQNEGEEVKEKFITCLQLSQDNNAASEEEKIISAHLILEEREKKNSREGYEKDLQDEKEIETKDIKNTEEASNFPKNKDQDEQDRNAAETSVTNYKVEGKSEGNADNLMKNVAAKVEESNKPDSQEDEEDGQTRAKVRHETFDSISLPQRNDASKDQDRENDSEQEKEEITCEALKHENIDHGNEKDGKESNQNGQFDCFASIPELSIPKLQETEIEDDSNMTESIQIIEDINQESSITKHTNDDNEASESSQFNASKEEKVEQSCHVAPIEKIFGSSKAIQEMTENLLEDIKQSNTSDETSKEHNFISADQTCEEKSFQDIEGTNSCKRLEANAEGSLIRNECIQEASSKPENLDEGYYLKTTDKIHAESCSSSFKGSLNESPWIDDAETEQQPTEKVIEPGLSTSKQIHEGMEVTELVMHNKIEEYETTKDLIPRQAADDLVEKRTPEVHHMAGHTAPCAHHELGYDSKHYADPIKIEEETEDAEYSYSSFYKDINIGKAADKEASKINVEEDIGKNGTAMKKSQICFEELNVATPSKQNEIAGCEREIEHSEMKVEEATHIKELKNEVQKTTIFEDEKRDADLSLNVQHKEGKKIEKDEPEYDVIYEDEIMETTMPDKSYAEIQASAHRAISVHKQIPLEAKSCTIHDDSYGEVAYKKDDKFIEGIEDDIINQMENKRTTDDETTIELGSRLTVQWDTPSKSNNTQAQVEEASPDPGSEQTKGLLDDYTGAKSNICPEEELKNDSVVDISHQESTFEGENRNINAKENLPKFEALSLLDASVIEANQEAAFEAFAEEHTQIEDGNSEERPSSHKGNNETLGQVEMEQGEMKKPKESVPLEKTSEAASSIECDQNAYLDKADQQANSEEKAEVINIEKNLQKLKEVIQIEPENDNFGDVKEKQYSVSNLQESFLKNGNGIIQELRAECETNIQSYIAICDRDANEETLPDEKIGRQDEYKDLRNDTSYRQLHSMPTEGIEEAKEVPHSSHQMEEMGLPVSGQAEAGEKSLTGETLDDKLEEDKCQQMDAILQGHKIKQAPDEKDTKNRIDKDGRDVVQQFDPKVFLDNSATELTMEDEYSGENQGDQIDSAVKMNETANDEILTIEIETDSTAGEDKLHLQDETQKATKITFNDGKQIVDTDQSAEENSQHKSNLVNDVYENPANEEAQHMNDKQEVEAEQSSMQDNKAQQNQIHERMIELDSKWSKEHHGIAGAPEKTDQEVKKCTASLGETIEQVDQNTEQISIYNAMIDNPTDIGVELVDYDHLMKEEIYSGIASAEVEDLEDNSSDVPQVIASFEENMQINECEVKRKEKLVEASVQEDNEKQTEESELAKVDYISKDYIFPELVQHEKSMQNVSTISQNVVTIAPEETDSKEPSEELAHETTVPSPKKASSVLLTDKTSVIEATNKEENIIHETAMVGDFEGKKKQHFDSDDLPASRFLMEHVLREEVEKHHRCHVEQQNEVTEKMTAVSLPFEHKLEEKGTSREAGPQKLEQSTTFNQEEKNSSEQDDTTVQFPSEHVSLQKYKQEEAAAEHITLEQTNNPMQGKQNTDVKACNAVPEENYPSINELIIDIKSSRRNMEHPTNSKLYEPTVLQESTAKGPIELFFYGEDITNKDGNGMEVLQDVRRGKENSIKAPEEHAQMFYGNSEERSSSYEGNNESIGVVEMEQVEMKKQKESVLLEKTPSELASSIECDQNAYLDNVEPQASSKMVEVIKHEKNLKKINEVIPIEPENYHFGDVQEKQYSVSNLEESCLKNGNGNIEELRAECETDNQSNLAVYGRHVNEETLPDEKIDTQDEDKDLQNDTSYRQLLAKTVEGIEEAKEPPHSKLQMEQTGLKVSKKAEAGEKSLTGGIFYDKLEGKSEVVDVILQEHKIEQAGDEKDAKSRTEKDGRDEVVEQFDTKVLLDNCLTELTMEDENSGENQRDQIDSAIKTNETVNDEILTTEIETDSTTGEDKLCLQDETQKASKIAFDDGKQNFDTDQSAEENDRSKSKPVNYVYENPANKEAQHMNDKQEVEAEHSSMQAIGRQQIQIHETEILKDNKFTSPIIDTIPEESWKIETFGENSSVNKNKEEQGVNKGLVVLKAHDEKEIIKQTLQQEDQKTDQTSIYDKMTDIPTDIGVELVDDDHFKKEEICTGMASAEAENLEDNNSSDVHQVIASVEENMQINECELIRKDILVEASDQEDGKQQTKESELAKVDYISKDNSFSELVQNKKSMENLSTISDVVGAIASEATDLTQPTEQVAHETDVLAPKEASSELPANKALEIEVTNTDENFTHETAMAGDFEDDKKTYFDSNDLPVSRFLIEHVLREEVEKHHTCHVEQVKEKDKAEEMTEVSLLFEHNLIEKGTSQEAGPEKFEQSTNFDQEEKNSSEQDETAVQLPSEYVPLEKHLPEEAAADHITLEPTNNPMQGKQNNDIETSNVVPEVSINELIIETKSSSQSTEHPMTSKLYEPTVLQESTLEGPTELFFYGEGITNNNSNGKEILQDVRKGIENSNAVPEENSLLTSELIIETKVSFQSEEHLTISKELKPANTNSNKKSELANTTRSEMVDSKGEVSHVGAYPVEESCVTVSKNKHENIQTKTNQELEESTDEEKDEEVEETHKNEEAGHETSTVVVSREADVKPSHKKSHNILAGVGSKVKHSIAKVKKAIIGKSSHSKTSTLKGEKVVHHG